MLRMTIVATMRIDEAKVIRRMTIDAHVDVNGDYDDDKGVGYDDNEFDDEANGDDDDYG